MLRHQNFIGTQQTSNNERSFRTPLYYYRIDSDSGVQFASAINLGVINGDYLIKVSDKNNCIDTNAND